MKSVPRKIYVSDEDLIKQFTENIENASNEEITNAPEFLVNNFFCSKNVSVFNQ